MLRIQRFLCLEEQTDTRQPMRQSNESTEAADSSKQSPNASNCMIRVTDVTVASSTSGTVFRDAQLELKQGSTTVIWGPVGCGKTTLLKTILGEVMPESGHVEAVSMSIGYCDQSAWLLNVSIRDNIIGQCTFDLAWYTRVVFACALDLDFAALINGDQTMAGTGGLQLSGGQKQRVVCPPSFPSMPRAVLTSTGPCTRNVCPTTHGGFGRRSQCRGQGNDRSHYDSSFRRRRSPAQSRNDCSHDHQHSYVLLAHKYRDVFDLTESI